jgi:16S rRNA (guanine966-N2)-methyltransferase
VVLVDSSAAAIASVRENTRAMATGSGAVRILRQDALVAIRTLAERGERFDVIYLDPPYDSDLCLRSLALVACSEILAPGGVAVAEHFHKSPLPETIGRLAQTRSLRIGDHVLTFYGSTQEESSPS